MKANVPEKIYFDGESKACKLPVFSSYNIEYTRTDAFVEKVYKWLKNYAFVDDNKNVNLPTLLHDFFKDSRTF